MEARSGSEVRPDTAALRALADEWHSVTIDPTTVRALCDAADEVERLRKDVEALHGLLSAGAIGTAPGSDSHRMVLAMRDHYKRERDAARDEVERLRAAVVERDTRLAETIRYHDARVNRADEATDASRTAHAALVAELRALCDRHDPNIVLGVPDKPLRTPQVPIAQVRDLLDRHAPTLTTTED